MNIGAPAAGMNSAVRAFVRTALCKGHSVLGIENGIDGLLQEKVYHRLKIIIFQILFYHCFLIAVDDILIVICGCLLSRYCCC